MRDSQTFESIGVSEELGLKDVRIFNKKKLFENHISIYKTHLERDTTPAAVFYFYSPKTFFWDDPDYVNMHDERIKQCQIQQLRKDIEYWNDKISSFDSEIFE